MRWAVVPCGSFEQHGGYLPLATDTAIAYALGAAVAARLPGWCLPPVPVGCSQEHAAFPGTVSVPAPVLYAWVTALVRECWRQGVPWVALVSGHGGNYVLQHVAQELSAEQPDKAVVLLPHRDHWQAALARAGLSWSVQTEMHVGAIEVALWQALWGEPPGRRPPDHVVDSRPLLTTLGLAAYAPEGVVGQPSLATPADGRRIWTALVDEIVAACRAVERVKTSQAADAPGAE